MTNEQNMQAAQAIFAAARDARRARPLCDIAREIRSDWRPVDYAAAPYLGAMFDLDAITDSYGTDSGVSIVAYFLSNARSWRGDVAKRVKAELRSLLASNGRAR